MRNYKDNLIMKMSFQFALKTIEFVDVLEDKRKFAIANQLIRAGCSIGANVKEAQGAESKSDFIHKMKIAYKEAEETEYWLELCEFAKGYPKPGELLMEIENILRVLGKIISSAKRQAR